MTSKQQAQIRLDSLWSAGFRPTEAVTKSKKKKPRKTGHYSDSWAAAERFVGG